MRTRTSARNQDRLWCAIGNDLATAARQSVTAEQLPLEPPNHQTTLTDFLACRRCGLTGPTVITYHRRMGSSDVAVTSCLDLDACAARCQL